MSRRNVIAQIESWMARLDDDDFITLSRKRDRHYLAMATRLLRRDSAIAIDPGDTNKRDGDMRAVADKLDGVGGRTAGTNSRGGASNEALWPLRRHKAA